MEHGTRTDDGSLDRIEAQLAWLADEVRRMEQLRELDQAIEVGDCPRLRAERHALEERDTLVSVYPPGHPVNDTIGVSAPWTSLCHCNWNDGADTREAAWAAARAHVERDHRHWGWDDLAIDDAAAVA